MKLDFTGMHPTGIFRVERGDENGVNLSLEFTNIVLNAGRQNLISRFPGGSLVPGYLYLGTGTSEPKPTDTGLVAVGTTGKLRSSDFGWPVTGRSISASAVYASVSLQFDYSAGQATGTWTELGLAYGGTYTEPYNRALFRDINGPIAITVASNEWLRVHCELRMYFPTPAQKASTILINGQPHDYTIEYASGLGYLQYGSYSGFWTDGFPNAMYHNFSDGAYSRSVNTGNKSVAYTVKRDPGDVRTYGGGGSSGAFKWVCGTNLQKSAAMYLHLIPEIVKAADEKLDGTLTVSWFFHGTVWDEGSATGGSAATLVNAARSWTVDEFAGKSVEIYAGTGHGQTREIVSNTGDTLTVTPDWDTPPASGSLYEVHDDA